MSRQTTGYPSEQHTNRNKDRGAPGHKDKGDVLSAEGRRRRAAGKDVYEGSDGSDDQCNGEEHLEGE